MSIAISSKTSTNLNRFLRTDVGRLMNPKF